MIHGYLIQVGEERMGEVQGSPGSRSWMDRNPPEEVSVFWCTCNYLPNSLPKPPQVPPSTQHVSEV